jgi:hypothetical protein
MEWQDKLRGLINGNEYQVAFRGNELSLIVLGIRHFCMNRVEVGIIENLKPEVVLHEDLTDTNYRHSSNSFEYGGFYNNEATLLQKNLIDGAPIVDLARHYHFDVEGIDLPYTAPNDIQEDYFFIKMCAQPGVRLASIGAAHVRDGTLLRKHLDTLDNAAVVYV